MDGLSEGISLGMDTGKGCMLLKLGWLIMGDGADDVDGATVVVAGRYETEDFDDGVDDHDELKGSQIGLRSPLLDPLVCVLKYKNLLEI